MLKEKAVGKKSGLAELGVFMGTQREKKEG